MIRLVKEGKVICGVPDEGEEKWSLEFLEEVQKLKRRKQRLRGQEDEGYLTPSKAGKDATVK